jgi:hypothetical protein
MVGSQIRSLFTYLRIAAESHAAAHHPPDCAVAHEVHGEVVDRITSQKVGCHEHGREVQTQSSVMLLAVVT